MVSIIIPTYNREKTIKKSIMSVLEQSYCDLELIVVDDGSTDNTRQVVESINDRRLRYVYQDNAGACAARNRGIDIAEGEYIGFHDSDDIWRKEKLKKQVEILNKGDVDLVFCKLVQHGETEKLVPKRIKEGLVDPIIDLFGIGTQTILAKRKVFESYRFDEKLPRYQDFELIYNISKDYKIYCIDEGLVDYYIGSDSISVNSYKLVVAVDIILSKHPELPSKYPVMALHMKKNLKTCSIKDDSRIERDNYTALMNKCRCNLLDLFKCLFRYVQNIKN